MASILRRVLTWFGFRALDAAGSGRRWQHAPRVGNLNADILRAASLMRGRAAYYARNHPNVSGGVDALVANIVGTGIVPQPAHPNPETRERLSNDFLAWTDRADLTGRLDFYGMQAAAVRLMVEAGEAFVRLVTADGGLRLQLIHPDQVPTDKVAEVMTGGRIRGGIEFDPNGRRVAYHILRNRPGDALTFSLDTVRVPAADMIHLFVPLEPGQVRGLSWLTPVLLKTSELDQFDDAQVVRQKMAAMFAGFITDPDGTAGGLPGVRTGDTLEVPLEPGTMQPLPPGSDVRFSNPAELGDYAEFVRVQKRSIAVGMGATYQQVSGDYSDANYSSLRASLVEFRRRVEQIQHQVVVFQLCRPVWSRWLAIEALAGRQDLAGIATDPGVWRADWLPPRWHWVDPLKDVNAELAEIAGGLKSRTQAMAERGIPVEQNDAELAADAQRLAALGVVLGNAPTVTIQEGAGGG